MRAALLGSNGRQDLATRFRVKVDDSRLRRRLAALESELEAAREQTARDIAVEYLRRVIPRTPFRTGRARGGWHAYLLNQGLPVPIDGPGTGRGQIEGTFRTGRDRQGPFVEATNRVSYIRALEFGHSKQAPRGFARITEVEMNAGAAQDIARSNLNAAIKRAGRG